MRDELDILFSMEDSDIENIAENYPAAGDKEKEKIYEICKRKYNTQKSEEAGESEKDSFITAAEGVEEYRRPKLYRFLSMAAAFVLIAGGIGGYVFIKNRNSLGKNMGDTDKVEQIEQTESGVPQGLIDELNAVTDEMLGKLERYNAFHYGTGVEKEDSVQLKETINITDEETSANHEMKFNFKFFKVTDEEVNSFDKMKTYCDSFLCENVYKNLLKKVVVSTPNNDIDCDEDSIVVIKDGEKLVQDDGNGQIDFIEYDGKLYSCDYTNEKIPNVMEFSKYELVSSEFYDENAICKC